MNRYLKSETGEKKHLFLHTSSRQLQKKRPPKVANPKKLVPQALHSGTATLTFNLLLSFSPCLIQKQRYNFFSFRKKKDFNNKKNFAIARQQHENTLLPDDASPTPENPSRCPASSIQTNPTSQPITH